jgi:hypothetical protein
MLGQDRGKTEGSNREGRTTSRVTLSPPTLVLDLTLKGACNSRLSSMATPATVPPAARPQALASGAGQAAGRQRLAGPAAGEEQRRRSGRGRGATAAAWPAASEEPGRTAGHGQAAASDLPWARRAHRKGRRRMKLDRVWPSDPNGLCWKGDAERERAAG